MTHRFAELLFTEAVRRTQAHWNAVKSNARYLEHGGPNDRLTEDERGYLESRDGFYLATVSESGWPYLQYRGGPPGFVRVLDEKTIGWADFGGNRQYISMGNLSANDRAALFFMDYARQQRLKLLGHVTVSQDRELIERLAVPGYEARLERAVLVKVEAFDWNCPQHITPRFSEAELQEIMSAHASLG